MSENIKEIVERISYSNGKFPEDDLQILLNNQEEVTPILLDAIRNPEEVLEKIVDDIRYFLPFYALIMLAQFREREAYPLICEFFSTYSDEFDEIFGDFITEDLGRVLASVCGGDVSLINRLVEDQEVDESVRIAAAESWLSLVRAGIKTREETVAQYEEFLKMPFEEESFLCGALVQDCLDLGARELLPEIKRCYDNNLVDIIFDENFEEVEKEISKDENSIFTSGYSNYDLIGDTTVELKDWDYHDDEDSSFFSMPELLPSSPGYQVAWDSDREGTFIRETPKVGPNNPCPCKSGRKYKKCCQNKK